MININCINNLSELGNQITDNLANSKLINLTNIMEQYNGNDWYDYIHVKDPYYKELVYKNNLIEIFVITWSINESSKIHTHPDNGCLMKILYGSLTEEKYDNGLKLIQTNLLNRDKVSYIEGNKILHKIINQNKISVSLHIYSPPNFIPLII